MTDTNFITIKDNNSTPIWDGAELYMFASAPLSIAGSNNIGSIQKNFLDIDVTNDTDYAANFDRRKSPISYGGFKNQIISLKCIYNPLQIGTTFSVLGIGTVNTFTPSKLYELILQPRVVHIKDEFLIRTLLSNVEGSSPAVYSSNGIPVALQGYKITPSLEGKEVIIDLTFIEAQEIE